MAVVISSLLLGNFLVSPVFATRTIQVMKEVDVGKNLLAKQLTDLKSYKEVFPAFIKEIKIDQNTNRAKFIIDAQGRKEADVVSSVKQDGTFVVEIMSGDLKGSKIITKLKERTGFDGTPNGATIIKSTLILETSWLVSLALSVIDDKTISNAVGDGFYDLGQYVKQYQEPEKQPIQVDYEETSKSKSHKNYDAPKPTMSKKTTASRPF
jgi:hypothetical protein